VAAAGFVLSLTAAVPSPAPAIAFDVPENLVAPPETSVPERPRVLSEYRRMKFEPAFQAPFLQMPQPVDFGALEAVSQATAMPPWTTTVEAGDTLDGLLSRAEIDPALRAEIALAVAAEYDLRGLRPGHRLGVNYAYGSTVRSVMLSVDDGVRIEVTLGREIASRTLAPDSSIIEHAGELTIAGSIYASLEQAEIPARFAVDLAQILGDTVNFRRDLQGGEDLRLLWSEAVLEDGTQTGQPRMTYAALEIASDKFEIVWADEDQERAAVYFNGEILRMAAPPVKGARLSSVFGQRKHPVYGTVRMHSGVDYAAAYGSPISATAPGRISFIGRQGGYGRVVEIFHGSDTMTRYAHLSAVTDGMSVGDRVTAGETIGKVGASGTATGPHLHYEVRIAGHAIDPLGEDRLAAIDQSDLIVAKTSLAETRRRFFTALRNKI